MTDDVRPRIRDARTSPPGVLPRRLQMWLMLGLAFVIVAIIAITGRPEPQRQSVAVPPPESTRPVDVERIRAYQERLTEQEVARRRQAADVAPPDPLLRPQPALSHQPTEAAMSDPLLDEQRRRDAHSLFADNVAYSRRAAVDKSQSPPPSVAPSEASGLPPALSPPRYSIPEGSIIPGVLTNRLDGTFSGPVNCLVTSAVFSHDRQRVLIPAGARLLGTASKVQGWADSRLAVAFHRLLMPDGTAHSLESFPGLNQTGETGLHDEVDRHYFQVFGASVAIGALSGLAQLGTSADRDFANEYRRSAGASLAESTGRVLDRYLNVLPTIAIREGHRVNVYVTKDLELPPYADVNPTGIGVSR